MIERGRKMLELIKNYFIILPVIFLVITVILMIKTIKYIKKYIEIEGIIVDFYENASEMRLNQYEHKAISPIIAYEVDKKQYEFVGNYYSTSMKKGNKIKIIYNPQNPKQVKIKSGIYFASIILSIFTIVSFLTYIIIIAFL